MERTYEEIEKDILNIRKDIVAGIRKALKERGYGIDDTVSGRYVSVKVDKDWDHIVVCDNRNDRNIFYHVDNCSVDTLLEAYRTVLHTFS